MSAAPEHASSREAAKARAEAYRESEQFHLAQMAATDLPLRRETHRIAAERFAQLATADERLATSPPYRL